MSWRITPFCCLLMLAMLGSPPAEAQSGLEAPGARVEAKSEADRPQVLAFYYPWYGVPDGPGGSGRSIHWGHIDVERKEIKKSTHYPALGPYDSNDSSVIDRHMRWTKRAGLDGLIVSWWGHDDYTDKSIQKLLDSAHRHERKITIYYETVPAPKTPVAAWRDISKLLVRYAGHPSWLRARGQPVVFIYGRAVNQLGLPGWLRVQRLLRVQSQHREDAPHWPLLIGDRVDHEAAEVFQGLHVYNPAAALRDLTLSETEDWTVRTYARWVGLAKQAGRISSVTVIPGYDDTKVREPGLRVERHGGELYRAQWEEAISAAPDWVLVTSFNEWHEGTEIEPSLEQGDTYLRLTRLYADHFRLGPLRKVASTFPKIPKSLQEKRMGADE